MSAHSIWHTFHMKYGVECQDLSLALYKYECFSLFCANLGNTTALTSGIWIWFGFERVHFAYICTDKTHRLSFASVLYSGLSGTSFRAVPMKCCLFNADCVTREISRASMKNRARKVPKMFIRLVTSGPRIIDWLSAWAKSLFIHRSRTTNTQHSTAPHHLLDTVVVT